MGLLSVQVHEGRGPEEEGWTAAAGRYRRSTVPEVDGGGGGRCRGVGRGRGRGRGGGVVAAVARMEEAREGGFWEGREKKESERAEERERGDGNGEGEREREER